MRRKYDLIFSLGGNCSVASNLQQRGLRPFSLPFDWVYFKEKSTLDYLVSGFRTRFSDLMQRENLIEITPSHPEWVDTHKGFLKFLDKETGSRFVNHFTKPLSEDGEYEKVYKKLRRRVDRLFDALESGQRFLLLLATDVNIAEEQLSKLLDSLNELYPGKCFDLEVLRFAEDHYSETRISDHLIVKSIARKFNYYDFIRTNYEWQFLDEVRSNTKPPRRRLAMHILPHLMLEITWNWKHT